MGFPSGHHLLQYWKIDLFYEKNNNKKMIKIILRRPWQKERMNQSHNKLGICN